MKEENVINYYVMCNKLKTVIRTGWKVWGVSSSRVESIAEHIYGTQMLAIAMKSEYEYDIDLLKVLNMLAIHELGETIIGDLTLFDISSENKKKIEHEAVHNMLSSLLDKDKIEELFLEFDEGKTKEAFFAYECDKLECDLQAKLYSENNLVDLNNQENNKIINNPLVSSLLNEGNTFGEMWLKFSNQTYSYDDNFKAVSSYALNNNISKKLK